MQENVAFLQTDKDSITKGPRYKQRVQKYEYGI